MLSCYNIQCLRSDLFQEQAKYNELKKMEGKWQACQSELEALKVKYLLQSELGGFYYNISVTILYYIMFYQFSVRRIS